MRPILGSVVYGNYDQVVYFGSAQTGASIPVGRDNVIGNPVPSLRVRGPWFWRFRVPLRATPYAIAVQARQPEAGYARPRMIVRANPLMGITEQIATAPAGIDWVTVGPITVIPVAVGALYVDLHNPENGRYCNFDNLTVNLV
jgi:hypothetical protein